MNHLGNRSRKRGGCEPLRGKIIKDISTHNIYTKMFSKFDVKSAVEFYKKYRDNMLALKSLGPKIAKVYEDIFEVEISDALHFYDYHETEFNNWLFDYCFGDVVE